MAAWLRTGWQRGSGRGGSVVQDGVAAWLNLPQWHHMTCGNRGGRPKSNHGQTDRQWLREKTITSWEAVGNGIRLNRAGDSE